MDSSAARSDADNREADKRARIIEGAVKAFLACGYQRTTMDDIARAAEMSRPSLYLQFRNKADIYRAIAIDLVDWSSGTVQHVMDGGGPLADRLRDALDAGVFALHDRFGDSPHAAAMLDMKSSLAGDLIAEWKSRLCRSFTAAIAEEADARLVDLSARDLSPEILASLLLDGIEGIKMRIADPGEQRRAARGLVSVVALAVEG
ncbi:TetR/AcrR family transcriptional regulator [Aquibium sp. ELW1220]|uniref:TetR/AcrR family transcriptional regulator n=1 Tax=Aquibium sp. ELW1220 TaxID=2976766 RepID=UPI0025B0FC52|nr:TetR/AcrR family transcriptional regulator [Aquibium sp. ELW1220]MDN2579964.1 TetR/AcrR family transcriptional regulator [Aquibium sp. ELW1220]